MARSGNYVDYLGQCIGTFRVVGRAPIRRRASGSPLPTEWWLRCRCGKVKRVQTCQIRNAGIRCKRCGERSQSETAAEKQRGPRLTGLPALLDSLMVLHRGGYRLAPTVMAELAALEADPSVRLEA